MNAFINFRLIKNISLIAITACGVLFIVRCTGNVESYHPTLLGEFDKKEFSFYIIWPKNIVGSDILIADMHGQLSGLIELNIFKDSEKVISINHEITDGDKVGFLNICGVHGYECYKIPRGTLQSGETYFIKGEFTGGINKQYSLWLNYLAPNRFGWHEKVLVRKSVEEKRSP